MFYLLLFYPLFLRSLVSFFVVKPRLHQDVAGYQFISTCIHLPPSTWLYLVPATIMSPLCRPSVAGYKGIGLQVDRSLMCIMYYVAELQSTSIPNEQLVSVDMYPSTYVSGYKLLVRDVSGRHVCWCKRGIITIETLQGLQMHRKYIALQLKCIQKCLVSGEVFHKNEYSVFIARQHTAADARYWYSNSVRPSFRLSVCLSVTRWYCMKTA